MNLARSERGAAMVIGLCFAVLLISLLFYVLGVAESVLFRERVIDAADTAAFSAAVVNARGMNLIALVNMTMAAILAILVGLRLAQTLAYVGIGLCTALAWPTGGASLSGVAPLTQLAKTLNTVTEKAKKPVRSAMQVMHTAGKAVSYVVPVGSNLGVIDQTVAHYGGVGVAIPSRLTLPVEDDEFNVLCAHAGKYASEVAFFPLAPILPSSVRDRMSDAAGKIVAAGGSWFCDGTGRPPDLNDADLDTKLEELPRFSSQTKCESLSRDPGTSPETLEDACNRAAVERLASMPDRNGQSREGQPLCPTSCKQSQDVRCPPKAIADCEADEARRLDGVKASLGTTSDAESAYDKRTRLARAQCRPESAGGRSGLMGFWWLERETIRTYRWSPAARQWQEDEAAREDGETTFVQRDKEDRSHPCGDDGVVGEGYEPDEALPACKSEAVCLDSFYGAGACTRTPPGARSARSVFRERTTEVVHILRCAYRGDVDRVDTPPQDLTKDMSEGKDEQGKKNEPPKPFRLERDVYLGGSDFQLRTIVYDEVPNSMQPLIDMASWGERDKGLSATMLEVLADFGGLALSQGEYYFDFEKVDPDLDDQTDPGDRTEWMWHMGWRARLRPFRFRHSVADAEREAKTSGKKKRPDMHVPGASELEPDQVSCKGLGDKCAKIKARIAMQEEAEGT